MSDFFILDEDKNVIPATLHEWGEFLEDAKGTGKKIVKQEYLDDKFVSTVFLGLDHGYQFKKGKKPKPYLFETMVFKSRDDIYCDRYTSWKDAEEGHQKALEWVKNGCKENENF